MREVIIYNYNKSDHLSLLNDSFVMTNPKGFGVKFSNDYVKSENVRKKNLTSIDLDTIEFDICFKGQINSYKNYSGVTSFFQRNMSEHFLVSHNDKIREKYCRVNLKSIDTTEVDTNGILQVHVVFEKISPWYIEENLELKLASSSETMRTGMPLSFPLAFNGKTLVKKKEISNDYFQSLPVEITIVGPISSSPEIILTSTNGQTKTLRLKTRIPPGTKYTISNLDKKIVIKEYVANGQKVIENAYNSIDKTSCTFLSIPTGKCEIEANLKQSDAGYINFKVLKYIVG